MKNTRITIAAIACLLLANTLLAQDTTSTATPAKKKHHSLTISNKGIWIESNDSVMSKTDKTKKVEHDRQGKCSTSLMLFDIGFNQLIDNTNYADAAVQSYLNVPSAMKTKSLFDLRGGKSINVNINPWMLKYTALKTRNQRIYISTGIGLQLYNFRFDESLTYTKNPAGVTLDTIAFKKDKLALNYLNVPLMFTFKTRISKKRYLVYGAGITEGLRIGSLNKQVSTERGKVKTHGSFGLADFNTCINGELGIEDGIRFYVSYQVTSLYSTGLDQHPISFGVRISGI